MQHSHVESIVLTAYITAQLFLALATLAIISRALIKRAQELGLITGSQAD